MSKKTALRGVYCDKLQKDLRRLNSQFVQFKKEKAGNAASPLHQHPNSTIKPIVAPTPTMAPTQSSFAPNYQISKLALIIAIVLFLIICIFILILDSRQDRITEKLAKLADIIPVMVPKQSLTDKLFKRTHTKTYTSPEHRVIIEPPFIIFTEKITINGIVEERINHITIAYSSRLIFTITEKEVPSLITILDSFGKYLNVGRNLCSTIIPHTAIEIFMTDLENTQVLAIRYVSSDNDHQNSSLIIAHDTAQAQYLAQLLKNISKF